MANNRERLLLVDVKHADPGAPLDNPRMVTADKAPWCNAVYWSDDPSEERGNFPAGSIVFCKIDMVMQFFERLRMTMRRVVLVSAEGDFPCDEWRQSYLPRNVVHWFATNVTTEHPRVTAIPLGLGHVRDEVTLRECELTSARLPGEARDAWLYVNFRPATNPAVREPLFSRFEELSKHGNDWITLSKPTNRDAFLSELVRHRFALCPPGNGVDTHRMWESLAAGVVPVVLRSTAMKPFESLPILFVDSFDDVTLPLLTDAWKRLQFDPLDQPLLQESHWRAQVEKAAQPLASQPKMGALQWIAESGRYVSGMLRRRLH